MTENVVARTLLTPFSWVYGLGVSTRNFLYEAEILKSSNFSIPVISIGNLSIGGAGKTPHIEYLINLLNPYINVATLSRGYNRNTKGFRWVTPNNNALTVGDEPLMYARKHSGIVVAVDENRSTAIPQILARYPDTQAILLDDAYQHRSVQPFVNILLTQYEKPFFDDSLLPAGRLREHKSAYDRADIIIITKCPSELEVIQKDRLIQKIKPKPHQKVFFTKYSYYPTYNFYYPNSRLRLDQSLDVILVSAIANTSYLIRHIEQNVGSFTRLEYTDHHNFTKKDAEYISQVFKQRDSQRKLVLTTEKDAMRLDAHRRFLFEEKVPIYILPLEVEFLFDEKEEFDELIKSRLLEFKI